MTEEANRTVEAAEIAKLAGKLKADHIDVLVRLAEGRKLGPADRREDRVRQTLRRFGFIAYCGTPHRWQITENGLRARAALSERSESE